MKLNVSMNVHTTYGNTLVLREMSYRKLKL